LLLGILLGVYFLVSFLNDQKEEKENYENYTPEEEISEAQYRETIVNLYFLNKETKEIMAEARAIDAKTLSSNPYKRLVELLLEGTENEMLEKAIPEGVKVYDANIEAGCVIINVSKEILNFGNDETLKNNIINTIAKTLTELTEVEKITFLIEGEENKQLAEEYSPTKN
jgi:spore germination protein GerM